MATLEIEGAERGWLASVGLDERGQPSVEAAVAPEIAPLLSSLLQSLLEQPLEGRLLGEIGRAHV